MELKPLKNIRTYYLAFVVYWGAILFGYDTGIAGGVIEQTAFKEHFLNNENQVNQEGATDITGNIVAVLQAGAFFGALGSASISQRIGRKYTLAFFTLIFIVGAILQTISGSGGRGLGYIYSGRIIAGIGIGAISAVAPAFVSECSPKNVRGRITGLFQILVVIGVMISYFVNFGISQHNPVGPRVWQIPFGLQLVPAMMMFISVFTIKESPRWLASKGKISEAYENLAYLRRGTLESVNDEMIEIIAAVDEEKESREGLNNRNAFYEAFFGKGNLIRFIIAFVIFLGQQLTGQNTINYYGPQIFESIGYEGVTNSLLASGIYGVIKVIATIIFVNLLVDSLGRRFSLALSSFGMGTLFFIVGALLKTHPPPTTDSKTDGTGPGPESSSKVMAALLYLYVAFFSMGWGPLPWIYSADIFPTRTRHYGMSVASASQWLWNFVITRVTPNLVRALGWKIFVLYGSLNIALLFPFSLWIPETKGRGLEEMDVIFGAIPKDQHEAKLAESEQAISNLHQDRESSKIVMIE
ncbi:general substrate transporter [Pyrrhoderma noxium]|uniref:General substrate transporter n=1 Tax=Pyrrhoderma noxium TaxID=2282107 RepID=A0A286UB11_9AGAM|nr:general substrate transporter [Pyrrhoderma noxium]